MTESNPCFEINGINGNSFKMLVERFFGISKKPRKVVAVGKIVEGEVNTGESICIKSLNSDEFIKDIALKIEVNNKTVFSAIKDDEIGICLTKTNLRKLRAFNG